MPNCGHIWLSACATDLTSEQLLGLVSVLRATCGPKVAKNVGAVLEQVLASRKQVTDGERPAVDRVKTTVDHLKEKNMSQQQENTANIGIFPRGEKNEAFAKFFTGTSYLNMLSTERVVIGNVTFEPGCRNFWHIHHKGGQILLVTGGRGWYQEWGQPAPGAARRRCG